jgi:hypothetical protein
MFLCEEFVVRNLALEGIANEVNKLHQRKVSQPHKGDNHQEDHRDTPPIARKEASSSSRHPSSALLKLWFIIRFLLISILLLLVAQYLFTHYSTSPTNPQNDSFLRMEVPRRMNDILAPHNYKKHEPNRIPIPVLFKELLLHIVEFVRLIAQCTYNAILVVSTKVIHVLLATLSVLYETAWKMLEIILSWPWKQWGLFLCNIVLQISRAVILCIISVVVFGWRVLNMCLDLWIGIK